MTDPAKTLIDSINERLSNENDPYQNYYVEKPGYDLPLLPSLILRLKNTDIRVQIPFSHEDTSTLYPVNIITEVMMDIIIKKIKEYADVLNSH